MKAVLVFLFVFGLIVIMHELGHFLFAKWSGILVREFSIGVGPKLFSHQDKSGTTYTIRMLPLGGYVRMAGLGEEEMELNPGTAISLELNDQQEVIKINTSSKVQLANSVPMEVLEVDLEEKLFVKGYLNGDEDKETVYPVIHDAMIIEEDGTEVRIAPVDVQFQSAKLYQRMLTNIAGPVFNFILAFVLFVIMLAYQGGIYTPNNQVASVADDSPAMAAGLKDGDKIISIAGEKINAYADIGKTVQKNADTTVPIVVDRQGQEKTLSITPKEMTDNGEKRVMIGITSSLELEQLGVAGTIKEAGRKTKENALLIFTLLRDLLGSFSLDKLGGPVMIFQASSEIANQNIIAILSFTAVLSVNLGIMNLLPIPMLDGGKLLFNLVEGIRRKPLSPEWEMRITMVGAAFLVGLMVLVMWNDIMRFLGR
ncbi:RIP metalloprotease RseP [Vagococcus elongatus]|uniref:Zinc metalloprotease n=1 Tax=Vagococcus elongatus TaxID=180344 RepID=A0A430ALV2_9ENTE|nr:RIP metalloprotease RseP [Vagococcus elongatus]RSU08964.1 RIP metalloprotease RseP [Vagococcus elongatus]